MQVSDSPGQGIARRNWKILCRENPCMATRTMKRAITLADIKSKKLHESWPQEKRVSGSCRFAQVRKCAVKFTTNRSQSVKVHQNPAGGITALPERGSLKTGVSQKNIQALSVLIIHDRLGFREYFSCGFLFWFFYLLP